MNYIIGRTLLSAILLYLTYLEAGPYTTATFIVVMLSSDLNGLNIRRLAKTMDKHLLRGIQL